jgi:hypothetical protein
MTFGAEVGLAIRDADLPRRLDRPVRLAYSVSLGFNTVWYVSHPPPALVPYVPAQLGWAEALPVWALVVSMTIIAGIAGVALYFNRRFVRKREVKRIHADRLKLRVARMTMEAPALAGWLFDPT